MTESIWDWGDVRADFGGDADADDGRTVDFIDSFRDDVGFVLIFFGRSELLLFIVFILDTECSRLRLVFGFVGSFVDFWEGFLLIGSEFRVDDDDTVVGFNDCERFSSVLGTTVFFGIFLRLLIAIDEVELLLLLFVVDVGWEDDSCLMFNGDLTTEFDVRSDLVEVFNEVLLTGFFVIVCGFVDVFDFVGDGIGSFFLTDVSVDGLIFVVDWDLISLVAVGRGLFIDESNQLKD